MSKPRPGKDYIIVALDVDSVDKALELVKDLRDHVGLFKVGLELIFVILGSILGAGNIYEAKNEVDKAWKLWWLLSRRVMLDVKLYDIPNTMQGAARAICSRLGVRMLTLHASSTQKGMAAAVAVRGTADVVAVTVLTSFDSDDCNTIYGRETGDTVRAFALMAREAGVQCLVCSPKELGALSGVQIKKITPRRAPLLGCSRGSEACDGSGRGSEGRSRLPCHWPSDHEPARRLHTHHCRPGDRGRDRRRSCCLSSVSTPR